MLNPKEVHRYSDFYKCTCNQKKEYQKSTTCKRIVFRKQNIQYNNGSFKLFICYLFQKRANPLSEFRHTIRIFSRVSAYSELIEVILLKSIFEKFLNIFKVEISNKKHKVVEPYQMFKGAFTIKII